MLVVQYLSAQKNIYLNYMKYTTTKKLLSNLSICLFSLALAGCSPKPKSYNRKTLKSTPSANKESREDMTKNAPINTPPNKDSKLVIHKKEQPNTLCNQYNWADTPTTISQKPNNPAETEDCLKLLHELEGHCKVITELLENSGKILSNTERIRQKAKNGSNQLQRAIEGPDTNWKDFLSLLQKAQEADKTLQPRAEKATGNHAANIKACTAKAQTNLRSVNENYEKIEKLITGAKAAAPPKRKLNNVKNRPNL